MVTSKTWPDVRTPAALDAYAEENVRADGGTAILLHPNASEDLDRVFTYMNTYRNEDHTLKQPLGAIIIHYLTKPTYIDHQQMLELFHFFQFETRERVTQASALNPVLPYATAVTVMLIVEHRLQVVRGTKCINFVTPRWLSRPGITIGPRICDECAKLIFNLIRSKPCGPTPRTPTHGTTTELPI